jgi:RNA polymerase sigma-70 factor (ECF subfamily)
LAVLKNQPLDAPGIKDEDLVRKVSIKDIQAFRQLVERYEALVYNTCYNLLHDHHRTEEAAQDVFLKIYRSARTFRYKSKVSTWIYRIAVNQALNHMRRNRKSSWMKSLAFSRGKPFEKEEVLTGPDGKEPDKMLEQRETRQILQDAVDSLPEKQRVSFILHKYDRLSAKEISEILGISVQSVEARLHRAKCNLQKKLIGIIRRSS